MLFFWHFYFPSFKVKYHSDVIGFSPRYIRTSPLPSPSSNFDNSYENKSPLCFTTLKNLSLYCHCPKVKTIWSLYEGLCSEAEKCVLVFSFSHTHVILMSAPTGANSKSEPPPNLWTHKAGPFNSLIPCLWFSACSSRPSFFLLFSFFLPVSLTQLLLHRKKKKKKRCTSVNLKLYCKYFQSSIGLWRTEHLLHTGQVSGADWQICQDTWERGLNLSFCICRTGESVCTVEIRIHFFLSCSHNSTTFH